MITCNNYCGVTCVNGNCPNAIAEEYGSYLRINCMECFYNEGCSDCAFFNTEYCEKRKDE